MSFSGQQFTLPRPLFSIPSLRSQGSFTFHPNQTVVQWKDSLPWSFKSISIPQSEFSLANSLLKCSYFVTKILEWFEFNWTPLLWFSSSSTPSGLCWFLSPPAAGAELLRCCSTLGLNPVTTRSNLSQSQKKIRVRSDCQGLSLMLL